MPKQATSFDLTLPPREPGTPAHRWLYAALRNQILEGRLHPGGRLPSTRDLATQYRLSRGTIVVAFEQLKAEGYLEGSVGSGTYVSRIRPDDLLQVPGRARRAPAAAPRRRNLSEYGKRVQPLSGLEVRPTHAFRANVPALDLFPLKLWAQLVGRRLADASASLLLGCDAAGYLPLRSAIAEYLGTSRGVKCIPEQVIIVSGIQEALDLTARLLLDPGDRVCMEDPGYPGATAVFEAVGARVALAASDQDGMEMRDRTLQGSRLIYVTPAHQFPLGTAMSLSRRLALLEWARHSEGLIFEDDYDSEYRYAGRPLPALQGLDRAGVVLFAGSFSKVLFPSLRLGYLVVPPDLVDRFAAAVSVIRRHLPLLEQAVLCDFMTRGHFARHIRRMRQVYAERLSVLLEAARQRLSGLLEISTVEAGLQTVGWLAHGLDGELVASAAARRGVEVVPVSRYRLGGKGREGLQLGFAAVDPTEIRRGVRELGVALETASS